MAKFDLLFEDTEHLPTPADFPKEESYYLWKGYSDCVQMIFGEDGLGAGVGGVTECSLLEVEVMESELFPANLLSPDVWWTNLSVIAGKTGVHLVVCGQYPENQGAVEGQWGDWNYCDQQVGFSPYPKLDTEK